jgi:phosphoglucan,water dikinase
MPLGNGLGVDHHAASVFVEAEVRSNVLFQLSRILSAAMKTAKNDLHAPPWTALQPGSASGKLVEYDSLQQLVDSKPGESCASIPLRLT